MVRLSLHMTRSRVFLLWLFVLAVLLSGLSAVSAASDGNDKARAAYQKAMQFDAVGNARTARIELMNAIKQDPRWIEPRVAQAQVLLQLSDGVAAEAELERAIELGLTPSSVRHLLGHAYLLQGKLDAALEQLRNNDIPRAYHGYTARIMGNVAQRLGDNALATRAFDRAVQLDIANPDLWVDIAVFRNGLGDQAGAIAAIDEAVHHGPAHVRALQYRAKMLRSQFGLAAAIPWFERALQVDPNNVAVLTEYGATLGDMGRMTDMLVVARRIISLDGRNARAFFMQAVLAARAGQYDLARVLMQKTRGQLDDVPAAILVGAIIENADGNHRAAIEKFRRLVSLQPNNLQAQRLLARSLYLADAPDDSVAVLARQVSRDGAAPYALWLAGRAHEAAGGRLRATALFNRAAGHDDGRPPVFTPDTPINILQADMARDPENARTVIPYIRALVDQGNLGAAYGTARQLQKANPGASDAHILVADIAMASGNLDAASAALDRAREIRFSEPVMLRLFDVLRQKGDLQQSGELLAQYLAYNPGSVEALRWMAYTHLETENWDVARKILEHLRLRIGNNDALIMAGLAQAYTGLGRIDDAIAAGRIAYAKQPSSPVVAHLYGLALLGDQTRIKDAIDLIQKSVSIAPDVALYRQSLARAYAMRARQRSADV